MAVVRPDHSLSLNVKVDDSVVNYANVESRKPEPKWLFDGTKVSRVGDANHSWGSFGGMPIIINGDHFCTYRHKSFIAWATANAHLELFPIFEIVRYVEPCYYGVRAVLDDGNELTVREFGQSEVKPYNWPWYDHDQFAFLVNDSLVSWNDDKFCGFLVGRDEPLELERIK